MHVRAQPVPSALHACKSITSDKERLACFDRELARLDSAAANTTNTPSRASNANAAGIPASSGSNPTSVAANPTPPANASLPPEQTFGLSSDRIRALEANRAGTKLTKLKSLTAQIASVSHDPAGHWVFKLDTGQVWRQSETRSFEATPGVEVKISSGAMGSFWLATGPHNWTRVERVL